MTSRTSTKMPRLRLGSQARFESAVVRGAAASFSRHRSKIQTHKLPGIGTYVIDTPKDPNLSAREKCFRYQEIHRGVARSKLKTLPDIPKRYDMKTLPVAKLQELKRSVKPPVDDSWRMSTTPNVSDNGSNDESRLEKARRQDSWKLPSQEELVSRSPIGRMEASITGFGVRKPKQSLNNKSSRHQHREFTYLSTNLALSEPEPAMVKATERELESQAEYRKQLTFYLSNLLNSANATPQPDIKFEGLEEQANYTDIPYDYDNVGHSSKNLDWENNLRLGDMLINTTPDLRKKLRLDEKSNKMKDDESKKVKKHVALSNDMNNAGKSGSCNDISALSSTRVKDSARSNPFVGTQSQHSHQSFHIAPSTNMKRSNSFAGFQEENKRRANVTVPAGSTNKIEIVHLDEDGKEYEDNEVEYDDEDVEKWMEVVNMPVVESGGYDRYANVKLPPWGRTQPKGNENKHLVASNGNRSTGSIKGSVSLGKHSPPSALS